MQPPKARLTPAGHGENGVLPTINSPLPLFLTLAVWLRDAKGKGNGGSASADEIETKLEKVHAESFRACISFPTRDSSRNLPFFLLALFSPSPLLQYFSFRFSGLPGMDACR